MTGVVRSVDRTRGALELAADGETFTLRYPPSALAGISPGDRVTARMTIMRAAEGTSTKGAGSFATDPETGSPGVRPPGAER